jgi:hypothetical protein
VNHVQRELLIVGVAAVPPDEDRRRAGHIDSPGRPRRGLARDDNPTATIFERDGLGEIGGRAAFFLT